MNEWILKQENDDILLEDVFLAYYNCRKNKRNKIECLEFDLDYEVILIKIWEEINKGDYKVSPLSVFIVEKPVKREIFAAVFKDRVVHHLIVMKLENILEKEFIYDSYSCRKGKGTHFGIRRIEKFIRKCSKNYKEDCYLLKLDIASYFMSINKVILLNKLEKFINDKYIGSDKMSLINLIKKIISNNPTDNCKIKSLFNKWSDLPKSKSLFYAKENCGLPIGNYTNQVFANFYLNEFDHFIKSELKTKYYGRYVDDFILISNNKDELIEATTNIRFFLKRHLEIDLHPKKIYLQNINHGAEFLGSYIKPWRKYITPRIKNNFNLLIFDINEMLYKGKFGNTEKNKIRASLNSYLGVLGHVNSFHLRKSAISKLDDKFHYYFECNFDFNVVKLRK